MSQPDPESGFLAVLPRVKSATVLIGLPPEQLDDHAAGMGTGFFAVETGLVLTSNHVVESHVNMKMAYCGWMMTGVYPLPSRHHLWF